MACPHPRQKCQLRRHRGTRLLPLLHRCNLQQQQHASVVSVAAGGGFSGATPLQRWRRRR